MHAETGHLITLQELNDLPADQRAEYVEIHGKPEQVSAISTAVAAEREAAAKMRLLELERRELGS